MKNANDIKKKLEELKTKMIECGPGHPNIKYLHEDFRELKAKLDKLEGK